MGELTDFMTDVAEHSKRYYCILKAQKYLIYVSILWSIIVLLLYVFKIFTVLSVAICCIFIPLLCYSFWHYISHNIESRAINSLMKILLAFAPQNFECFGVPSYENYLLYADRYCICSVADFEGWDKPYNITYTYKMADLFDMKYLTLKKAILKLHDFIEKQNTQIADLKKQIQRHSIILPIEASICLAVVLLHLVNGGNIANMF